MALQEEKDRYRFEYRGSSRETIPGFRLIQISDIQTASGSVCPQHVQVCAEISYILSGKCRFWVNQQELELQAGDVVLIRAGDVHSYHTHLQEPARICNLGLELIQGEDPRLEELWTAIFRFGSPALLHRMGEADSLFNRICAEIAGQRQYWEYALSLQIRELLTMLYRGLHHQPPVLYSPGEGMHPEQLFHNILHYVDGHLEEGDLKEMEQVFHYSYAWLARVFRQFSGESLSHYCGQRRFAHAAELLAAGCTATEAAARMGYQSLHAFSKAFRKHYGLSPTQYLERLQDEEKKYGLG